MVLSVNQWINLSEQKRVSLSERYSQELKGHQAKTKAEIKLLARKKLIKMSKNSHELRGIFFRCFVAELL